MKTIKRIGLGGVDMGVSNNPSFHRGMLKGLWATRTEQSNNRRNWGMLPYYGIVKDNTGFRAQVTIKGKKVYIAHSINDIEFLVNTRNEYIDKHNLPCKKNIWKG